MKRVMKSTVLALAGAVTMAMATGTAAAQGSFGGMPTVTKQDKLRAERLRRVERIEDEEKKKKKVRPTYVTVDSGGPRADGKTSFDSIQDAVNAVAWGGVVVVMPGIYRENVVLSRSVSLQGDRGNGAGVRIVPAYADRPCLSFVPDRFNDHATVSNIEFRAAGDESTVQGSGTSSACVDVQGGIFTMVGSTVDGGVAHSRDLVNVQGGTVILEKNVMKGGLRGIHVNLKHEIWDRALLIDNNVSGNTQEGIHLAGEAPMLATGNFINTNGKNGIVYNGAGEATLVGNKILNNGSDGVLLGEQAEEVLVRLNQIWSNKGHGIKVVNSRGLVEDNDIDGNCGMEVYTNDHLGSLPLFDNDRDPNTKSSNRANRRRGKQDTRTSWRVGNAPAPCGN